MVINKHFIWVLTLAAFLLSCSHYDKTSRIIRQKAKERTTLKVLFVAQSKDSTWRYFIFHKENYFEYIQSEFGKRQSLFRDGRFIESKDSFHLQYNNDFVHPVLSNYLLKDSSGEYLIYPSTPKAFLKIKYAK
jgi:hypothetical protein